MHAGGPTDRERGNGLYKIVKITARIVMGLCYDITVEGRRHLPPDGCFVLLPKHQRWQDVPLVGLTTPVFLTFVAKHELFANPLSRYIITRLGGIPLNRKHPMESRRTLRAVRTHLQSRRALVVFPEGTYYPYSMGPGNLGMLRYIMSTAQVPLIPVGICYEKHRLRPGVRIRFGAPIHPNDTRGPHALLTEMMDRIAELSSLR